MAGSATYFTNRWLLCLPIIVIVQSQGAFHLLSLLALLITLYYTNWAIHIKAYTTFKYVINFLRYRRVEKHCERCEIQLADQLTESVALSSLEDPPKPQLIGWRYRSIRKLPWRIFSRHWGRFANTRLQPHFLNTLLIWWYANGFGCNLDEAEKSIHDYETLGAFFTRKLKPGLRVIDENSSLLSPADGTISFCGLFASGYLEQVKGTHYSINYFLGLKNGGLKHHIHASSAQETVNSLLHVKDGSTAMVQTVIYLSPSDYHRFHSPADWTIRTKRHFPGEMLSVKPSTAANVPGLFHLNERVAWLGDWKHGFFSMTAVAATNVGDIVEEGDDHPEMKTNQAWGLKRNCTFMHTCATSGKKSLYFSEAHYKTPKRCMKGQPFGHFNLGSTIVLLFEAPRNILGNNNVLSEKRKVLVGQSLLC